MTCTRELTIVTSLSSTSRVKKKKHQLIWSNMAKPITPLRDDQSIDNQSNQSSSIYETQMNKLVMIAQPECTKRATV